jgi:transposase
MASEEAGQASTLDDRFHETGTWNWWFLRGFLVCVQTNEEMHHDTMAARGRVGDDRGRDRKFGGDCTSRERARILLSYRENLSFFAVGKRLRVHHQTVERCVERAPAYGPLMALDDRPRPGKEPTITPEAKAWLVSLACDKAKDHRYPHELWTTRLCWHAMRARTLRSRGTILANLAQGTVCKILGQEEVKPQKVRYYLERRDADFEQKMAEVLCVYREVQVLKKHSRNKADKRVAIVSYDEKPGIQAIAATTPDLPPQPGVHRAFARDHEYKRQGTVSLLAGIDLLTGKVHALVRDRPAVASSLNSLSFLTLPPGQRHSYYKLILDNHAAHISKETRA